MLDAGQGPKKAGGGSRVRGTGANIVHGSPLVLPPNHQIVSAVVCLPSMLTFGPVFQALFPDLPSSKEANPKANQQSATLSAASTPKPS